MVAYKAKLVVLGLRRESFAINPLSFLLVYIAEGMNHRQEAVIDYLQEEARFREDN